MKLRLVTAGAVLVVMGMLSSPFAVAAVEDTDSATVGAALTDATRSLVVTVGTVTLLGPRTAMAGTYGFNVLESVTDGDATFRVTGDLSPLTFGPNSIASSAVTASSRATTLGYTVPLSPAGVARTDLSGTAVSMGSTQDLMIVTGESAAVAYTGTHTNTGTLTLAVPDGKPSGAYTGTLTYTLLDA